MPSAKGLCPTCSHEPDCSLTKKGVAAVLDCEEFEPGDGVPGEAGGGGNPGPEEDGAAGGPGGDALLGLCVNCAKRETCSFPKPEGGLWHCEEYWTE